MARFIDHAREVLHSALLWAGARSLFLLRSVGDRVRNRYSPPIVSALLGVFIVLFSGTRLYDLINDPAKLAVSLAAGFVPEASYSSCEEVLTVHFYPPFLPLDSDSIQETDFDGLASMVLEFSIAPSHASSRCDRSSFEFALEGDLYESAYISMLSPQIIRPIQTFLHDNVLSDDIFKRSVRLTYANQNNNTYAFLAEGNTSISVHLGNVDVSWGMMRRRIDIFPFVDLPETRYGAGLYGSSIHIDPPYSEFVRDFSREGVAQTATSEYHVMLNEDYGPLFFILEDFDRHNAVSNRVLLLGIVVGFGASLLANAVVIFFQAVAKE